MSPSVQAEVRAYVLDPERGRPRKETFANTEDEVGEVEVESAQAQDIGNGQHGAATSIDEPGYVEMERNMYLGSGSDSSAGSLSTQSEATSPSHTHSMSRKQREQALGRVVDVVLSDMCEPWDQIAGFGSRSVSNAYGRMMNTTGVAFKDHVGSMVCFHFHIAYWFELEDSLHR